MHQDRPPGSLVDPAEWRRFGRGRYWLFETQTADLIQSLSKIETDVGDNFDILTTERTGRGRDSKSTFHVESISTLRLADPWNYFIRSRRLTPVLPTSMPIGGLGWPATFSLSGLINLQHPAPGRHGQSSLSIVTEIIHEASGTVYHHEGYSRLYSELVAGLKRGLPRHG